MTTEHANKLKDGDFIATEENIENLEKQMEENIDLLRTALLNREYNDAEMTNYQFERAVKKATQILEENAPKWVGFEHVDIWIYPENINEENYKVNIEFTFKDAEDRGHSGVFSFQLPEMNIGSVSSFNDTSVWFKEVHRNKRYDFKFGRDEGEL